MRLTKDTIPERLLTAAEMAAWMGVHPMTLKRYVRERNLPYHSRVGLRYRFSLSQVSEWLKLQGEG